MAGARDLKRIFIFGNGVRVAIQRILGLTKFYLQPQMVSLPFLPVMLAFTAAKKFKTNQFLSVAIAMALVYPAIAQELAGAGGAVDFFGLPIV